MDRDDFSSNFCVNRVIIYDIGVAKMRSNERLNTICLCKYERRKLFLQDISVRKRCRRCFLRDELRKSKFLFKKTDKFRCQVYHVSLSGSRVMSEGMKYTPKNGRNGLYIEKIRNIK